jgi:glycosyltransferase involved in cell wall biosynthesis
VVNSSASWGGNEHWAVRLARGFADRGRPVGFVWSHEVVGERVADAGLPGCRVRLGGDADLRAILALRDAMVRWRAGAVLLTRWREYLLGGLAARLAGRPRVVMGLGLRVTPRDDLKRRLIFRLADRVLVNAPEIRDELLARPWVPADRIAVVVNGVDLERWQPPWTTAGAEARAAFRRAHGIAPDAPLIVNVGSLTDQKDHANLVAACAHVRARVPDIRCVIIGDGGLRAELEREIAARGLAGTVVLAGFVADPVPAFAAADVFALSSRNEGMAWVLMEAAASGLPAVTTDVSGGRYCVVDGQNGWVVPTGDAGALAAGIVRILDDPSLARSMGRRARDLAERRFSAARMLDETERVLFAGPRD